jgi:hypothetical protein
MFCRASSANSGRTRSLRLEMMAIKRRGRFYRAPPPNGADPHIPLCNRNSNPRRRHSPRHSDNRLHTCRRSVLRKNHHLALVAPALVLVASLVAPALVLVVALVRPLVLVVLVALVVASFQSTVPRSRHSSHRRTYKPCYSNTKRRRVQDCSCRNVQRKNYHLALVAPALVLVASLVVSLVVSLVASLAASLAASLVASLVVSLAASLAASLVASERLLARPPKSPRARIQACRPTPRPPCS